MAKDSRFEKLFEGFQLFIDRCLLSDRSLLWPEGNIWTQSNLSDLRERFIYTEELGPTLSFTDKLLIQMKGANRDVWAILSDIYFIYFLPSGSMTLQKKFGDIQWTAQQGGYSVPPVGDRIWEYQKYGFTTTGQRYHQKYRQFWLILLFVIEVKNSSNPKEYFTNSELAQNTLDHILEGFRPRDKGYDMRHALLYLMYPEKYESIISTSDKEKIKKTYQNRLSGEVPTDIDKAIYLIREKLQSEYNTDPSGFSFFTNVLQDWRPETAPRARAPKANREDK